MSLKYLPIVLLLAATTVAHAQETTLTVNATTVQQEAPPAGEYTVINLSEPAPTFTSPLPLPLYVDGPGVSKVSLSLGLGIGYNIAAIKYNSVDASGKGIKFSADIGVKIPLSSGNSSANRFISASAGIMFARIQDNFKDKGPTGSNNNEYSFLAFNLPLSFTNVSYRSTDEKGFYWQAGANLSYMTEAEANGKKIIDHTNKFGFSPFLGLGLARMREYRFFSRSETVPVNFLIGPFVSYNATNVLSDSGMSMRYFSFGLMLTEVFL
ncbi:MAG: hypothetical protein V4649_12240 [Bacteroidota bacterium]